MQHGAALACRCQVVRRARLENKILAVFRNAGNLVIPVQTVAGHTYYLESTTNLNHTSVIWITNQIISGNGSVTNATVPLTANPVYQFFRYQAN